MSFFGSFFINYFVFFSSYLYFVPTNLWCVSCNAKIINLLIHFFSFSAFNYSLIIFSSRVKFKWIYPFKHSGSHSSLIPANVLVEGFPHLVHLRLRLLQSSVAGEVWGSSRRAPLTLRGPGSSWSSCCFWIRPADQVRGRWSKWRRNNCLNSLHIFIYRDDLLRHHVAKQSPYTLWPLVLFTWWC